MEEKMSGGTGTGNFAEKYGLEGVGQDKNFYELAQRIEEAVRQLRHFNQFNGPHVLMLSKKSFTEIISEFRHKFGKLLEMSSGEPVSIKEICIKTDYTEDIVRDILEWLDGDVIVDGDKVSVCSS